MQKMQDFITAHELSMTTRRVDQNPNMVDAENMDHWQCTIRDGSGDTFNVFFSMGYGHTGKPPELGDVLDCLASDAAGYENAPDFAEWASEYGYDTDSRKAEAAFKAVKSQSNQLERFFVQDAYQDLLWETERC